MAEGMKLYKRAEALASELENIKEISAENVKKFEELVRDFFKNPTQESGFTSAIIWRKINTIFENHFEGYYREKNNGERFDYSQIVLQCYIDCFCARCLELYDIDMAEKVFCDTDRIGISEEIENFYDDVCDRIKEIAAEVAEYLAKEHVTLDGMSKMTTEDGDVMSKFIDHPGISEHEDLWIRIWIVQDGNDELSVSMLIVPQEKGAAAVGYDMTAECGKWISGLK